MERIPRHAMANLDQLAAGPNTNVTAPLDSPESYSPPPGDAYSNSALIGALASYTGTSKLPDGDFGNSSSSNNNNNNNNGLLSLPSVEQMQEDVANATCELQQTYLMPQRGRTNTRQSEPFALSAEKVALGRKASLTEDIPENQENAENPLPRTREEVVSEELLINGKTYRHTYQRKVVLERQKTREVFMLPACSGANQQSMERRAGDDYTSANFENYNKAFDESCARLDLSVQNLAGAFSPIVMVVPQGQSPTSQQPRTSRQGSLEPGSPVKTTHEGHEAARQTHWEPALEEPPTHRETSQRLHESAYSTPLVVSHMYHFGHWDKTSSILDPRLPAGLGVSHFWGSAVDGSGQGGDGAGAVLQVSPAEWHHSDISYGSGGGSGETTTAKGRIVACLQRFTQRSTNTGKQLHRTTYVQHTKIARWRSASRQDETGALASPPQHQQHPPTPLKRPQGDEEEEEPVEPSAEKPPPLNLSDAINSQVPNVSDVWKQGARSPLSDVGFSIPPASHVPLESCSFERLQLLQSLCPAAAAAVIILGRQMPEMRARADASDGSDGSPTSTAQKQRPLCTVTADAWCPRTLMLTEPVENSLIFSSSGGMEPHSPTAGKHSCFLRGGTLDALLVYVLHIYRQNKTDTFESLIPDIFMRIYPTFTVTGEVLSRLIQRYLVFTPIEPGGLAFFSADEGQMLETNGIWNEGLNTLKFLLKLLKRTKESAINSQLKLKIVRLAELIKLDAKSARRQLYHAPKYNDSTNRQCGSPEDAPRSIGEELIRIADCLAGLVPKEFGGRTESPPTPSRTPGPFITDTAKNGQISQCNCMSILEKFLKFGVRDLAENITLIEEEYFNGIDISELINIKQIEKGNTPTLSRCVKHFNDLNAMVKTIIQLARETVQFQSKGRCDGDTGSLSDATDQTVRTRQYHSCSFCGHQRNSDFHSKTAETRLVVNQGPVVQRCNSFKNYLCMPPSPSYLSLRTKRSYSLIDNTIWKMRLLAEELKKMNNFSSFLAVILGLQNSPTQNVSKKLKHKLNEFGSYMLPPSFTAYRRDLEAAKMPCLPYLGLVFQQLIHLDSGNPLFLAADESAGGGDGATPSAGLIAGDEADANKVINFWRCWKHYLILGYFMKRADQDMLEEGEKRTFGFTANTEIQAFLNTFTNCSLRPTNCKSTVATPRGGLRPGRSQRAKTVHCRPVT